MCLHCVRMEHCYKCNTIQIILYDVYSEIKQNKVEARWQVLNKLQLSSVSCIIITQSQR